MVVALDLAIVASTLRRRFCHLFVIAPASPVDVVSGYASVASPSVHVLLPLTAVAKDIEKANKILGFAASKIFHRGYYLQLKYSSL
jgi:hypothetical protein